MKFGSTSSRSFVIFFALWAVVAGCGKPSEGVATPPPLPSQTYVAVNAPVARAMLVPSLEALDKEPSEQFFEGEVEGLALPPSQSLTSDFDTVAEIFDGRVWTYHDSCKGLVSGHRVFLMKRFDDRARTTREEAIAWGLANGYRPATHIDAIAFGKANPGVRGREICIIAPGSVTMNDAGVRWMEAVTKTDKAIEELSGDQVLSAQLRERHRQTLTLQRKVIVAELPMLGHSVTVLGTGSGGRDLDEDWLGHPWSAVCRFLFVRK